MKLPFRATLATATAVTLTGGLLTLATAVPATAAAAKYADDFNGDGYRDYAVPSYGPDYESKGGGIQVTFGTASGPGTKTQFIDQASPGVPGADEANDEFGWVRTAADFNADGYGDLAVSAPGETVEGVRNFGAVTILWGGANGLSGGTTVPNKAGDDSHRMGSDLATGDFNGDGKQDLALINRGVAYVHRGSIDKSGVHGSVTALDKGAGFRPSALISGKVNKDGKTDLVVIGDVLTDTSIASDAWFIKGGSATLYPGKTLRLESQTGNGGTTDRGGDGVIADFDKDGYGDIAIGTAVHSKLRGRVSVWYGASAGPDRSARFTQATSGVAGTPESYDEFGWSVSAGDVNGDGYQDLAVGAPGEAINGKEYAGGVHVLFGRASGLSGQGSQWFARNSAGVPGALRAGDQFGYTVRLRDTDADGRADLHVNGTESSVRLPGSPTGVTTSGATAVEGENVVIDGTLQ